MKKLTKRIYIYIILILIVIVSIFLYYNFYLYPTSNKDIDKKLLQSVDELKNKNIKIENELEIDNIKLVLISHKNGYGYAVFEKGLNTKYKYIMYSIKNKGVENFNYVINGTEYLFILGNNDKNKSKIKLYIDEDNLIHINTLDVSNESYFIKAMVLPNYKGLGRVIWGEFEE